MVSEKIKTNKFSRSQNHRMVFVEKRIEVELKDFYSTKDRDAHEVEIQTQTKKPVIRQNKTKQNKKTVTNKQTANNSNNNESKPRHEITGNYGIYKFDILLAEHSYEL